MLRDAAASPVFARDVLDKDAGARRAGALALLSGPWITGLRVRIASTRVG